MEHNQTKKGLAYGILAYVIWGILPIYWKLLSHYDAMIVLSHRILWSFVFMVILITFTKTWEPFMLECKKLFKNRRRMLSMIIVALLISANWLVFIWAVQNGYVIQSSLGYYINPIINIILGVIFLQEKLNKSQIVACLLALIGVSFLTFYYGVFPWVSLSLAISFGLYGLLKKIANLHALYSLAIETMIVVPIVFIYFAITDHPIFIIDSHLWQENILLILSGVATAVPLLLFGSAVKYLTYTTIGFLQYIGPTLMLLIGVFVYKEAFTYAHAFTFACIWLALIVYMTATFNQFKKLQK